MMLSRRWELDSLEWFCFSGKVVAGVELPQVFLPLLAQLPNDVLQRLGTRGGYVWKRMTVSHD